MRYAALWDQLAARLPIMEESGQWEQGVHYFPLLGGCPVTS
jgi:hypothetical protein